MEEIFRELERQINQNLKIQLEAQQIGVPVIFPLNNGEKEEEREVTLYIVPFVKDLQALAVIPVNPSRGKIKKMTKKNKGKKVVKIEALEIDTEDIWIETFLSEVGIDFNDPIIQEKITSITTTIVEKLKQTRKDTVVMKKIYNSSIKPEMKDAFQKSKEQK